MSSQKTQSKPDRGGSRPGLSPADDRANVKNPKDPSYAPDQENQRKQREQASGGS